MTCPRPLALYGCGRKQWSGKWHLLAQHSVASCCRAVLVSDGCSYEGFRSLFAFCLAPHTVVRALHCACVCDLVTRDCSLCVLCGRDTCSAVAFALFQTPYRFCPVLNTLLVWTKILTAQLRCQGAWWKCNCSPKSWDEMKAVLGYGMTVCIQMPTTAAPPYLYNTALCTGSELMKSWSVESQSGLHLGSHACTMTVGFKSTL